MEQQGLVNIEMWCMTDDHDFLVLAAKSSDIEAQLDNHECGIMVLTRVETDTKPLVDQSPLLRLEAEIGKGIHNV